MTAAMGLRPLSHPLAEVDDLRPRRRTCSSSLAACRALAGRLAWPLWPVAGLDLRQLLAGLVVLGDVDAVRQVLTTPAVRAAVLAHARATAVFEQARAVRDVPAIAAAVDQLHTLPLPPLRALPAVAVAAGPLMPPAWCEPGSAPAASRHVHSTNAEPQPASPAAVRMPA